MSGASEEKFIPEFYLSTNFLFVQLNQSQRTVLFVQFAASLTKEPGTHMRERHSLILNLFPCCLI